MYCYQALSLNKSSWTSVFRPQANENHTLFFRTCPSPPPLFALNIPPPYLDLERRVLVVLHEVVVGLVVHTMLVTIDLVSTESDTGSEVVDDGVEAENIGTTACVEA